MKNMFSWLVIVLAVMFWLFRIVVCYTYSMGMNIGFVPYDLTTEIIVLFASFFGLLLAMNRKRIGGVLYCVTYVYYFGLDAFNGIKAIMTGSMDVVIGYSNLLISIFAIILAIGVLMDVMFNKDRSTEKDNKNTFWFYKNKKYDRELDERADKNEYRIK